MDEQITSQNQQNPQSEPAPDSITIIPGFFEEEEEDFRDGPEPVLFASGAVSHAARSAGEALHRFFAVRLPAFVRRHRRLMTGLGLAGIILLAGIALSLFVRYRTYGSYTVLHSRSTADTLSYSYVGIGDGILRYGIDSSQLMDQEGEALWSDHYDMKDPQAEVLGETAVVYDRGGVDMILYDMSGKLGEVNTEMPIVKAALASQGVAAAILENGEDTWIRYYNRDGSEIASFRTRMDSPGYPMDISLSPDGMSMAVSYVYAETGAIRSQIAFYNFGSVGQNQVDNLISSFSYGDQLSPDVTYVDASTCIAFFENGFHVYQGTRSLEERCRVEEERDILSYACCSDRVALVERGDGGEYPYILKLFDLNGRERFSRDFDFSYEYMRMDEHQLLFFSRQEMCVYSLDGVEKYRGAVLEGQISNIIGLDRNRYMAVSETGLHTIRLR